MLKQLRAQFDDGSMSMTKSANQISNDFYLGAPDKLLFLVKEFKSELHPDYVQETGNPLLVSKLDVSEVAKFDFPRLRLAEVDNGDQLSEEKLTKRMIELAKLSISRKRAAA